MTKTIMRKICKENRRLFALLAMLFSFHIFLTAIPAYAGTAPDLSRKGSVSVSFQDKGTAVSGGELCLYPIAYAFDEDGDFVYEYTNGLENCGIELGNLEDSSLASRLEAALPDDAKKTTLAVGSDGKAVFTDLTPGLYLLKQTKAAEGYEMISSFLISVPEKEGESWIYDLDASPKMETLSKTEESSKKTSKTPTGKTASTLPQTGQLNWPIPILAIAGLSLLLIGRELSREKKTHEA